MKRNRYSVEHSLAVWKQAKLGTPVAHLIGTLTELVAASMGVYQVIRSKCASFPCPISD